MILWVFAAILLLASSSAADAVDVIRITDNSIDDGRPAISGSYVVWHAAGEIYFWDGSFPAVPIQVTDDGDADWNPAISGSNVVWQSWDGNDFEIHFWDGSFPIAPVQITNNSTADANPAISGSNVVWQHCDGTGGWQCDVGDYEIHFWDGSFPVVVDQITNNPIDDVMPAISGSNVVWEGHEPTPPIVDTDIYFWDGTSISQITDTDTLDWRPDISGSTVMWVGMFDGDQRVLRWDGSFPVVPMAVSEGTGGFLPAISGSNVVWQQGPFGDTDIYASNGATITNISSNGPILDEFADISGSTAVWHGCVFDPYVGCLDGTREIYMATIPAASIPSTSAIGLVILAAILLGTALYSRPTLHRWS